MDLTTDFPDGTDYFTRTFRLTRNPVRLRLSDVRTCHPVLALRIRGLL